MRSRETARRRRTITGRLRSVWQGEPAPAAATEQQVSLLAPKLRPPRLPGQLITRQRLLALLDEGLERKLTVLSAPAGFGKTTLVSQWIARHRTSSDGSLQPPFPVAWVSLESGDNDTTRFWRYLLTACQVFRADLGTGPLALLHTAHAAWRPSLQQSLLEGALTMLLNELTSLSGQGVLVLEDYHSITTTRIHETLASFIEHLPPFLHVVLMTRSDPPLPLARWRAEGQLNEVEASDLRFSEDEIVSFLQQIIPFTLSSEEMERLLERTEGWGVGLRLLALALQGHMTEQQIEPILTNISGNHRQLLEYFVGEVLSAQPEPMQHFLMQTSLLASLNGPLCDAVTGRTDSEQWLETVERSGLFLVPLDHSSGRWYRYHALFAEAMQHEARRRLGEETLRDCLHRASTWYEQQNMLAEAVKAALVGADFTRAASLISNLMGAPSQLDVHEMSTGHGWLEQIPEQVFRERPVLALTSAIVHVFTADRYPPTITPLIEKRLQFAEQTWTLEGALAWSGRLAAFRALLAVWQERLPEAATFASRALASLPEEDYEWRGICSGALGEAARVAGSSGLARQHFQAALSLSLTAHNEPGSRVFRLSLGDVNYDRGALHEAAELYRVIQSEAGDDLVDRARALLGLALLSYEWNRLEEAVQEAQEALDLCLQLFDEALQVQAALVLARIHAARGETMQALLLLQTQHGRLQPAAPPARRRELLMWEARLQFAVGDSSALQRWATSSREGDEELSPHQREQEALLLIRWLLAQGQAQEALTQLEHLHADAQEAERQRSLLEIQMLQIRAYDVLNQRQEAGQLLLTVLSQTAAEGFVRLFLDEGEMIADLLTNVLPEIREQHVRTHALALAKAFAHRPASSQQTLLDDPLNQQELQVLRLLAAGRTRQEIADELVVSMNTVKTHLKRIYRKLDVTSHERACEVARNLHLL